MEGASQKAEQKKPPTALKRVSSVKSESETQTSVAVRVPSLKVKAPIGEPKSLENMVTEEQLHNASMARKRRMMAKKTQGVRTREKTPEPSRTIAPHEDTTTTDEEDQKEPKPHHEYEEEDSYLLMKKKIEEKNSQKDADDLDIDAIREAQVEQARERRRRSISPFALPSKEEIEGLQRKGSFIDPGNKLLTTPPSYPLTCKDEFDPSIRRNSLIFEESPRRESLTVPPPSPNSPINKTAYQLSTPPVPRKGPESVQETEKTSALPSNARNETNQTKTQKSMLNKQDPITIKPKQPSLMSYTNVNVAKPKEIQPPQNNQYPSEEPPVRPKRSKSGTRSQGRTSESEMSEDQSTSRVQHQPQPQKAPKPKERRRTIAAIKRSVRERSPAVRSKSATRPEKPLDISGIEITKTSAGIIDLLQKEARRKSMPLAEDVQKAASATKSTVDNTRQLMTPKRTLSPKRSKRGISCPKTIKILTKEETMESFIQAQRKSVEIERSRRSSGYVDASQSEITSSCYSSSYSEDESDFDLSKKSAELTKKLRLLQSEKEKEIKSTEAKKDKQDSEDKEKQVKSVLENGKKDKDKPETEKNIVDKSKKEKAKVENVQIVKEEIIIPDNAGKIEKAKLMYKIIRIEWKKFVVDFDSDYQKIKLLRNTCFSDLVILIILCGLGGIVFRYTEGAFENFYKCGVKRVKRDFIDSLWQGSHNMREEDWKSTARRKLWDLETQLHTAHEAGVHSYSGQKSWSFMNSMVYCLTVVTTIGYGHIAPSTSTGRALTIVYAIIGIPLFLILLADFGKLFTRGIKFLWAFVRRVYYTGSCRKVRKTVPMQEMMRGFNMVYEAASTLRRPSQMNGDEETGVPPALPPKPNQSTKPNLLGLPNTDKTDDTILEDLETQTPAPSVFEIDDEFNLPISVAIVSLIIYIFLGASVYVVWEEWDFFESFYFVFISMSTIGFGDYVPKHPMYMMCSIVYLVFGMSLTSMCINVVQVKLSDSFRQASAKIGATIGLRVSEEDGSLAPVTPPPVEIPAIHGGNQGGENIEPVKV